MGFEQVTTAAQSGWKKVSTPIAHQWNNLCYAEKGARSQAEVMTDSRHAAANNSVMLQARRMQTGIQLAVTACVAQTLPDDALGMLPTAALAMLCGKFALDGVEEMVAIACARFGGAAEANGEAEGESASMKAQ